MCGGLWRVAWLILSLAAKSPAQLTPSDRLAWIFEQWASAPLATPAGTTRSQASLNVSNYQDSFSSLGSALVDLGTVEVGIRASQRYFAALTDIGTAEMNQTADQRYTVGAGISRYYVTDDQKFGRIGVELLAYLPSGWKFIKFGIDSGSIATATQPWSLELHTNFFVPVAYPAASDPNNVPRGSVFEITGLTEKRYSFSTSSLALGVQLGWTYLMRSDNTAAGEYEHMLFSLGPTGEWSGALGTLRVFLSTRLYLDYEVIGIAPTQQTDYPSVWPAVPDVSLTWTVPI